MFGPRYGATFLSARASAPFSSVYPLHERVADLILALVNRAHNEVLETLFEGGAASLLLLLGFVGWLGAADLSRLCPRRRRRRKTGPRGGHCDVALAYPLTLGLSAAHDRTGNPFLFLRGAAICSAVALAFPLRGDQSRPKPKDQGSLGHKANRLDSLG